MSYRDVIIAGAGPAGLATAALLARAGWRVLLAEARTGDPVMDKPAETLCPDGVRLVQRTFLVETPPEEVACPARGVAAWWDRSAVEPAYTDYELTGAGPGWRILRSRMQQWLEGHLPAAVERQYGWRFIGARAAGAGMCVRFQTDAGVREIIAPRFINACGRTAPDAGRAAVHHQQVALWAECESSGAADGVLKVERLERGWAALQDVPGGKCQAMLVLPGIPRGIRPGRLMAEHWLNCRHLKAWLPELPACSPVRITDARLLSRPAPHGGSVLCGDVVSTTDPLAGRGWLRALHGACAAAAAVSQALSGSSQGLQEYAAECARAAGAHRGMLLNLLGAY